MRTLVRAAAIATLALLAACTDPEGATRTAENHGFTKVRTTGYRWFGCGKDDMSHTGFEALRQDGKAVRGVVCGGGVFGKSYTLRLD